MTLRRSLFLNREKDANYMISKFSLSILGFSSAINMKHISSLKQTILMEVSWSHTRPVYLLWSLVWFSLEILIWGSGEFQKKTFIHYWRGKKATHVRLLEVASMEVDRKSCMGKGGRVETTSAGIRHICLAASELCNCGFQFCYRDGKMHFKEWLRRIIEIIRLFL